jgi:gluconolactonase
MKRKLLLSLGAALCAFGIYSCQKDIKNSSGVEESLSAARGFNPTIETNITDLTHLIAPSARGKFDTLGTGFSFTEGPATDKHGNVFFTDQPNDKIYKWDAATKKISLFLHGTGRSNGMYFDKNGYLITCADSMAQIWSIAQDGSHTVLLDKYYNGKLLNGPNDIWINPANGGMYFTDPLFGRDWWPANDPRKQVNYWPGTSMQAINPLPQTNDFWARVVGSDLGGYVYYLSPDRSTVTRVATQELGWTPNDFPNGIIGSPDGKKLYVNKWSFNTDTSKTWSFDINADGTLSNMQLFNVMGGDGMTMDELGNVYIANKHGVVAFNPQGQEILRIPVSSGSNNVTFGGQNNKTLFFTGGTRVFGLNMNVKGTVK